MSEDNDQAFKALFQQFGKAIELDGVEPDADGYTSFQTEAGTVIHCNIEDDRLMLLAAVGRLPSGDASQQVASMKQLLAANAMWQGTDGATLSLEPTSDQVLLAQRWTLAELQATELQPPFETFLGVTAHWIQVLKPGSKHPPAHPDGPVGMHHLA